ncbi:unnamed protein product [Fusarium langsethiae]|nr:unnamed protein product [Fusarium langsethiae]
MKGLQTPETTASPQFPVGIEVLHDDPDAVADICFIHGVTGGRRTEWTTHQQSEPWLKTLLPPHLNNVRILSFGYDPLHGYFRKSRHLHSHATDLLTDIVYYRRQAPLRPLIFITHCIGGLVCQEAINISHASHDEPIANVFFSLRGIIFINTPYLDEYRKAHREKTPDPKGVTHLTKTNHARDDEFNYDLLRANFVRAMKYRPKSGTPVNITFLFSMLDIKGIVPVAPSNTIKVTHHVDFEFVPLRVKHADIIKIGSPEHRCFEPIVDRLNKWTFRTGKNRSTSTHSRVHCF